MGHQARERAAGKPTCRPVVRIRIPHLLVVACACVLLGAAPLNLPPGWHETVSAHLLVASWTRGTQKYALNADPITQSASGYFDILDRIGAHAQVRRLTICSIPERISKQTVTMYDGTSTMLESVAFIIDDEAYVARYWYAPGTTPDPNLESLLAGCPSDLLDASPPAGWSGLPAQFNFYWTDAFPPKQASGFVQLSVMGAAGAPSLPMRDVQHVTSCGVPMDLGTFPYPGNFQHAIMARAQLGRRIFTATYNYDEPDQAMIAAIRGLCVTQPLPHAWFDVDPSGNPLPTPEPVAPLRVKKPVAYRSVTTLSYSNKPEKQIVSTETLAADGSTDLVNPYFGGADEVRYIHGYSYSHSNGIWYRKKMFAYVGKNAPSLLWTGVQTALPDASVNGVGAKVYHIEGRYSAETIWVGTGDDYVHRIDSVIATPGLGLGVTEHVSTVYSDLDDRALRVTAPAQWVATPDCFDRQVSVVKQAPLTFPADLRKAVKAPFSVNVDVTIAPDGSLVKAEIEQSSGYPSADAAALQAARASTYAPGTLFCKPAQKSGVMHFDFAPN